MKQFRIEIHIYPTNMIPKEEIIFKESWKKWKELGLTTELGRTKPGFDKILCITPGIVGDKNFERVIGVGEDIDLAPKFLSKCLFLKGEKEKERILFESWNDYPGLGIMQSLNPDFTIPKDVSVVIFFPGTSSGWKKALNDRFGGEENVEHFKKSIRKTNPNIVFLSDSTFDTLKFLL